MKSYLFCAVSALSLIAASSASAHDDEGWYLRGNAGGGIHTDVDLENESAIGINSALHEGGIESETDFGYSFGGGYDFGCLLYTSPSPRDRTRSRMPSSA